ncbi:MAG TPA: hypothetical protein VM487_18405 [Phycisphaerae bacterium]|nr:hypothetical protein [Phycisphaerae bacterium]
MSALTDYCRTLADGAAAAWEDAPEQFRPLLKEASDTLTQAAYRIEDLEREAVEQQKQMAALRRRLRDQALATQEASRGWHDLVLDAINRHGGLPGGIDPQGHPIDQLVATALVQKDVLIERLRKGGGE